MKNPCPLELGDLSVHVVRVKARRWDGDAHAGAFSREFSRFGNEIQPSWSALLRRSSSFASLLSGTSNLLRAVSQTIPRKDQTCRLVVMNTS